MRFAGLSLVLAGCATAPAEVAQTSLPQVLVAEVERAPIPGGVLHGVTRSVDEAELGFVSGGRVTSVDVAVGDVVVAGQVLARVDATPLRSRLAALDAQLVQARAAAGQRSRDRARGDLMAASASLSDAELDSLATADDVSQASVQALESQRREVAWALAETRLSAPFSGVVAAIQTDVGEVVSAGRPVVSLRTADALEVAVQLPERWMGNVSVGDAVEVRFPLIEHEPVQGRVAHLSDAAGMSGLFEAEVALPAEGLRAGYTAEVWLPSAGDALRVPATALVAPSGDAPRVRQVRQSRVLEVPVSVLAVDGDGVFIDAPLREGELVVWSGHTGIADGDQVEVLP